MDLFPLDYRRISRARTDRAGSGRARLSQARYTLLLPEQFCFAIHILPSNLAIRTFYAGLPGRNQISQRVRGAGVKPADLAKYGFATVKEKVK
jgi:hypothetical protein